MNGICLDDRNGLTLWLLLFFLLCPSFYSFILVWKDKTMIHCKETLHYAYPFASYRFISNPFVYNWRVYIKNLFMRLFVFLFLHSFCWCLLLSFSTFFLGCFFCIIHHALFSLWQIVSIHFVEQKDKDEGTSVSRSRLSSHNGDDGLQIERTLIKLAEIYVFSFLFLAFPFCFSLVWYWFCVFRA